MIKIILNQTFGFLFLFLFSACTHINEFKGLSTLNNPALVTADTSSYTHNLKNISLASITASSTAGSPDLEMSLSVDTSVTGFLPLTQYCSASGSNACVCQLDWSDLNSLTSPPKTVPRTKKLAVTEVQSGLVKCQLTSAFWSEIATGVVVKVNIAAVTTTNLTGLNVKSLGYKKGTVISTNGDFLDNSLTPFRNIHRYSCYSKRVSPHEVLSQVMTSGSVNLPRASRFCLSGSGSNCATAARSGYSAQSYYRNLYARSDALGTINSTNDSYECPKVLEPLLYSADSAGNSIPTAQQGQYWPLDTSFALATSYSSEWSVGVHAASVLYKAGDHDSDPALLPTSVKQCQDEGVAGAKNTRLLERGITIKCMGYAKPPNADGTCGSMIDSNGRTRYLTRLRRFRAIYPQFVQPSGKVNDSEINEADEIYVPDRLVVNNRGVPTGAMIYGPKPCNFAWFDHEGVVSRDGLVDFGSRLPSGQGGIDANGNNISLYPRPGYVATSSYQYKNALGKTISVNPDGLIYPNRDLTSSFGTSASCSSSLSIVDFGNLGTVSGVHLVTSTSTRYNQYVTVGGASVGAVATPIPGTKQIDLSEVHINPIDAWTPNYVEDNSFQACVPVSDPYLEPPLHIYKKDANTYGWCSKAYPTQNPNYGDLNAVKKPAGIQPTQLYANYPAGALVGGYTSHLDTNAAVNTSPAAILDDYNSCKGTLATKICSLVGTTDVANCITYLTVAGKNTCDRTVMPESSSLYKTFPLQASDDDIVNMLTIDLNHNKNFTCTYSVHSDPTKIGQKVPSSACCGVLNGTSILNPLISLGVSSGHLEPFQNASSPNIRFCGNPVE